MLMVELEVVFELQIRCRGKVVLQGVGRSWGQVRVFVNILREEKSGRLNF